MEEPKGEQGRPVGRELRERDSVASHSNEGYNTLRFLLAVQSAKSEGLEQGKGERRQRSVCRADGASVVLLIGSL